MEWIAQLTNGEQFIAFLGAVALILLVWTLVWLARSRQEQHGLEERLEVVFQPRLTQLGSHCVIPFLRYSLSV